jgi:hypothetical protein
MLDFEYATALAKVLCEENLSDKVLELRFNGVRRLKGIVEGYAREGILELPLMEIWKHKLPFVLCATSKTTMEEILRPSMPRYLGGKFQQKTEYHSEAEEMILWSFTSLRGPLISEGFNRYIELFNKYFPDIDVG